jgi:hypothetical protein
MRQRQSDVQIVQIATWQITSFGEPYGPSKSIPTDAKQTNEFDVLLTIS